MFASADGLQSSVFHAVYGAAKAGIVSLAKNFRHLEDLAQIPGMGVSDYDSETPTIPTRRLAETVGE
jgi:hypothetical protein